MNNKQINKSCSKNTNKYLLLYTAINKANKICLKYLLVSLLQLYECKLTSGIGSID